VFKEFVGFHGCKLLSVRVYGGDYVRVFVFVLLGVCIFSVVCVLLLFLGFV